MLMAKVEFDPGIDSVRGILMGTDPFYIRRYPSKSGVMHIVQARPDRSGHTPSAAERAHSSLKRGSYGCSFCSFCRKNSGKSSDLFEFIAKLLHNSKNSTIFAAK